jgi:alpha-methylacyl-CoA racemase
MAMSDVVIEGFRPGVMERLGLGPAAVHERNAGVVYVRVTGWGQDGPYASMAGHDINYVGLTGALAAIGPTEHPMPPLNLVGDYAGGTLFALNGILAALVERASTGRGNTVDVAMVDGVGALLRPIRALMDAGLWRPERQANLLDGAAPFYTTYETADGRFMAVGALEPAFYSAFVAGLGLDEATLPNRFNQSNWQELGEQFADRFSSGSQQQWSDIFVGTDACVTPVVTMDEVMEDAHNAFRGAVISSDSGYRPAPAPRFGRSGDPKDDNAANDIRAVMMNAGLTRDEVDRLVDTGIVEEW